MNIKLKSFLCVGLLLGMTACSEVQAQKGVLTSEALLTVLEKAASQYIAGDFGTPDNQVVAEILSYDAIAYADIVKIRTAAQNNQTISTTETVAAATAISVFENYLISKNIIKKSDISE